MKWFKHDSDASNDAKLRKLRHKYGAQGYGVYWYCLELVARNVDKHNLTFELEHDAELIADDFKLSTELVEEMMIYMVKLGLFENSQGIITCLKMSTRTDEYTQKLLAKMKNSPEGVPTISGDSPTKSELTEEKRREEKDICPEQSSEPALFELPLNKKDTSRSVTATEVSDFKSLYPNVDIEQELRKMIGWLNGNPRKRKTASGIDRFIHSWLAKEQDKPSKPSLKVVNDDLYGPYYQ